MLRHLILVVAVALISINEVAGETKNVPLDALQSAFLSELKYSLRKETPVERCSKYLKAIEENLKDSSYGVELLPMVSKMLANRGSKTLSKFTIDCSEILQGREPVLEAPKPKPNPSLEVCILREELLERQAIKEKLDEVMEENLAMKTEIDGLSIKVIKANTYKLQAEKDLESCKSKLRFGFNMHLHHKN